MFASLALVTLLSLGNAESIAAAAAAVDADRPAIAEVAGSLAVEEQMVRDIVARSFPSLEGVDIRLRPFRSDSDYFRTSFSPLRFLFGAHMRYFVLVNPGWSVGGAPVEGVRSILAHELAHVDDLKRGKRIRLIRLVGLLSSARAARFERRADLNAIRRDYGAGLKAYRAWLYDHVPVDKLAEKRRDYFSPEEIDALVTAVAQNPVLLDYWLHHVPMNLADIQWVR